MKLSIIIKNFKGKIVGIFNKSSKGGNSNVKVYNLATIHGIESDIWSKFTRVKFISSIAFNNKSIDIYYGDVIYNFKTTIGRDLSTAYRLTSNSGNTIHFNTTDSKEVENYFNNMFFPKSGKRLGDSGNTALINCSYQSVNNFDVSYPSFLLMSFFNFEYDE